MGRVRGNQLPWHQLSILEICPMAPRKWRPCLLLLHYIGRLWEIRFSFSSVILYIILNILCILQAFQQDILYTSINTQLCCINILSIKVIKIIHSKSLQLEWKITAPGSRTQTFLFIFIFSCGHGMTILVSFDGCSSSRWPLHYRTHYRTQQSCRGRLEELQWAKEHTYVKKHLGLVHTYRHISTHFSWVGQPIHFNGLPYMREITKISFRLFSKNVPQPYCLERCGLESMMHTGVINNLH